MRCVVCGAEVRSFAMRLAGIAGCAGVQQPGVKAVYPINQGLDQAGDGLRNIRNHLSSRDRYGCGKYL